MSKTREGVGLLPRGLVGRAAKIIGLLAFSWLFVWPLAMLVYGAFRSSPLSKKSAWTLSGFERLFSDPNTYSALASSLIYAVTISIFAMAVAIFFATVSTRFDVPFRRWITPVMVVLVAMPTVLYSLAWAMLGAGQAGMINKALSSIGLHSLAEAFTTRSWFGLILVTVLKAAALAYLILVGAFRNQNSSFEEAARISGASKTRAFFGIELPALLPALLASSLFVFIKGLEAFETPAVLGQPAGIEVYSTHIYNYLRGGYDADYPAASAASLVIVLVLAALVVMQLKLTGGGRSYTTVGGRSPRMQLRKLGSRSRYLVVTLLWAYFVIALVLPIFQVALSAFQPYLGSPDLSMGNIELLLDNTAVMNAIRTTLIVSIIGGLLTVILSLVVGSAFIKMKSGLGRYIQIASWAPASMPGLVLGLAFLWSILTTPGGTSIYGTVWVLILGLAVATVPLATRTLEGALAQIGPELEDAARISGDNFLRAVTTVTVRLMTPSLIAAWFLVAITMSGILDVPILLGSTKTEMIATVSFNYYSSGETVLASALYVIFSVILAALALAALLVVLAFRGVLKALSARDSKRMSSESAEMEGAAA